MAMITTLLKKGHAYEANGHVLFQVSTMGMLTARYQNARWMI